MSRVRRSTRRMNADWAWWKMLAASIVGFGFFGALIGLIPPPSMKGLLVGLSLALLAVLAAMWSWKTYSWWARVLTGILFTLEILALAARCWNMLLPNPWLWAPFIGVAYITAWLLPAVVPAFSAVFWREQIAPQTRAGRFILGVSLGLVPVVGVLGASVGMFSSRFGELAVTYLVIAILGSVTAPGLAFAFAYQVWPDRPWADQASAGSQPA